MGQRQERQRGTQGEGRSHGPGWRIVRSIVRLLYLVPSFCGSLSHPPLLRCPPSPPPSSAPRRHTETHLHTSRTNPLALVLTPVFSPRSFLPFSPFFSFQVLSFCLVPSSPFLGLFPLSAASTTTTTNSSRRGRISSSRPPSRIFAAKKSEREEEAEEERDGRIYARTRARVAAR